MTNTMLKIAALHKKMKKKPQGQRLYDFFKGDTSLLTKAQIEDLLRIVDAEHEKTKKFLTEAIPQ